MTFESLGIAAPVLRAIHDLGYTTPTAIQTDSIPAAIEGRDILGCAQTGTGKTAAFAVPILHRLSSEKASQSPRQGRRSRRDDFPVRALVLAPTRELAAQIGDCFVRYGKHSGVRTAVLFGGVNQNPQTRELDRGVDVIVATPGRLLDLVQQGFVDLGRVESFVLDEADHMLDMGFLPDVRRIISQLPKQRQTLMFSATMPSEILSLAKQVLVDPVRIQIDPQRPAAETVDQSIYHVAQKNKPALLAHLVRSRAASSTIVFTRTKHGANAVVRKLESMGITAEAIHGNKSQSARQRALDGFKSGTLKVLIATDIAARGIDVSGVGQVINFDLPQVPETYVHRIGRTGRAGRSGSAISFCGPHEPDLLAAIERVLRKRIPLGADQPSSTVLTAADREAGAEPSRTDRQRRGGSNRSGSRPAVAKSPAGASKRPEHMRAKKAKTPTKQLLVESVLIRKGRSKPKPKSSHFTDPSPLLQP
ncbi:MAG: DEAD/DEAH box helicase [Planctomycetaceae bacterium]